LVAIQFINKDIENEIEFNMRLPSMDRDQLAFIIGLFYGGF